MPVIAGRALITGASAGIGEAYARRLALSCDTLVLVARRDERLRALAGELKSRCTVEIIAADLATLEGQARTVEAIRQGAPLDLLINNAGFSTFNSFSESCLDQEIAMLRLHNEATLSLTRAALPAMLERGSGAIVNLSSVASVFCLPPVATYAATKAFLLSFSHSLQADLAGTGVRVQCVCPGYTHTEIHSRETFAGFDVSQVPEELWMDAAAVVEESISGLSVGERWLIVPGEQNRAFMRDSLGTLLAALGEPEPKEPDAGESGGG